MNWLSGVRVSGCLKMGGTGHSLVGVYVLHPTNRHHVYTSWWLRWNDISRRACRCQPIYIYITAYIQLTEVLCNREMENKFYKAFNQPWFFMWLQVVAGIVHAGKPTLENVGFVSHIYRLCVCVNCERYIKLYF